MKGKCLRFFAIYAAFAHFLSLVSLIITYALLTSLLVIVLLAVLYRYVLNNPLQWAEETARYMLIWMTLVGASVAIKERKHVNLNSVVSRLPRKAALIIEILLYLSIILIIGIIAKRSFVMVITRSVRTLSPSLQISMVWAHSALPVGFVLMLVQSLYVLCEDIKLLIEGKQSAQTGAGPQMEA